MDSEDADAMLADAAAKAMYTAKHKTYLPISKTMHPARKSFPCYRAMVRRFPANLWAMPDTTFGAAASSKASRMQVSFFHQMIQWGVESDCVTLLFSLFDEVLSDAGVFRLKGYMVMVIAQTERQAEKCVAAQLASVSNIDATGEEPQAGQKRKKANSKKTAEEDIPLWDRHVSRHLISDERTILDVQAQSNLCLVEGDMDTLEYGMLNPGADDQGADASAPVDHEATDIFYMMHPSKLETDKEKEWAARERLPHYMADISGWYSDNEVKLPNDINRVYDFECIQLSRRDGFLYGTDARRSALPDTNHLRFIMQPCNEVPMRLVKKKMAELGRIAGIANYSSIMRLSDEEACKMFVAAPGNPNPLVRDFAQKGAPIEARDAFTATLTLVDSEKVEVQLTPIALAHKKRFKKYRKQIAKLVDEGKLDEEELDRVNDELAETIRDYLEFPSTGVPKQYHRLWTKRRDLFESMQHGDEPYEVFSRGMYWFDESIEESDRAHSMSFDSRMFCSLVDIVSSQFNATPQQTRIILKCYMYCATLLWNYFGPQNGVCMQGECDVGKTVCAMFLTMMFAPCMVQQENDSSAKSYLARDIAMTILFKDEMNIGNEKDKNKNGGVNILVYQSGLSKGYVEHNMLQIKQSKNDTNSNDHVIVSFQFFLLAAINDDLKKAWRSRLDMEETYREGKRHTGRRRTEEASKDPNRTSIKAAALATRCASSNNVALWVCEAFGAMEEIDMTLFTIYIALYNAYLVEPRGATPLMPRDIDKLRKLSIGCMVLRVVSNLFQRREFEDVADDPKVFVPYFQREACMVKMQDILRARNMATPSNAASRMDHLLKLALKRRIATVEGPEFNAEMDPKGQYFLTDITSKKDAAEELAETIRQEQEECNTDMMAGALKKMMARSIRQSPCIMFRAANQTRETLHVLRHVIDHRVIGASELAIVAWLHKVTQRTSRGTYWNYSYDERSYLFKQPVIQAIRTTLPSNTQGELAALAKELYGEVDEAQRSVALFWVEHMSGPDGTPSVSRSEDSKNPLMQMVPCDEALSDGKCRDDGEFQGQFKHSLPSPNATAFKISDMRHIIESGVSTTQVPKDEREFADMLMAVSGEASVGETIFYGASSVVDADTEPAVLHQVREWKGTVTIDNPERTSKAAVLNYSKVSGRRFLLPHDQPSIDFGPDSNLTERMQDIACRRNTHRPYTESVRRWRDMIRRIRTPCSLDEPDEDA